MLASIDNAGQYGLIKDLPDHQMPPNAWSDAQNIRFNEGQAKKFLGHSEVLATCPIAPYYVTPVPTPSTYYWIAAGLTKIYVHDGTSWTNITRQTSGSDVDYAATASQNWNGGILGGILVLNNGVDAPQMWATASTGTKMADLSAWPSNTKTKIIRPFRQFLVALDIQKSTTKYPRLVKWSHAAGFNSVPSSWDETDATLDAGEYELAETQGGIVDGASLRDQFIIYKEDSIWGMSYVGPPFIFRFYRISSTIGALSDRCVKEFPGGHLVLTNNDLMVNDGQKLTSVVDGRIKRFLFNNIDGTYYGRCFIARNAAEREMWVCYPSTGSSVPDQAITWSWEDGSISVRDIPSASHIGFGVVDTTVGSSSGNATWADTSSWASDNTFWNEQGYNPTRLRMLAASPTTTKLFLVDESNKEDTTLMTSYVERAGLTLDGSSQTIKTVNAVYPKMTASGAIEVWVGSQMSTDATVTWSGPFSFNPDTADKIDCRVSGRFLAFRFKSSTDVSWGLSSYQVEYQPGGRR